MLAINNLISNNIYFCKALKSKNNVLSKAAPAKDLVYLRPYSEVINERLKNVYGINSTIKDERILKRILPAVEDFCKINNDNSLFNGLRIEDSSVRDNNKSLIYMYHQDSFRGDYSILYNRYFDWNNLEKCTKNMFDGAKCASENPKYFIYKSLAGFLNFQYNPYASEINSNKKPDDDIRLFMYKVTDSPDMGDFNNSYVASKMCSEFVPRELASCFEDNVGNINLKYPPQKEFRPIRGTVFHFNTIKKATDYLYNKYNIRADFDNLKYANKCCGAVYDLVQAIGDKHIFDGLVIETKDIFDDTHVLAETSQVIDREEGVSAKIIINPAGNWRGIDRSCQKEYMDGYNSSDDAKNVIFIHELAHYLDFMGNSTRYANLQESTYKNEEEKAAARVSYYATTHSSEFCAEYTAGKMMGIKYPKATNELFEYFWNGPKINFP